MFAVQVVKLGEQLVYGWLTFRLEWSHAVTVRASARVLVCWDTDACVNGHAPCCDDFLMLLWYPIWIPMCTDIRSLLLSTNLLSGTLPDNATYWSGLRTLT